MNSLGEHGQDVSDSLHSHSRSLAALHGPHPALVEKVTGQRGQGGGGCPVGSHAEGDGTVGGLRKVLHVENEGSPEVQRQLLIPAMHSQFILIKCWQPPFTLRTRCWSFLGIFTHHSLTHL